MTSRLKVILGALALVAGASLSHAAKYEMRPMIFKDTVEVLGVLTTTGGTSGPLATDAIAGATATTMTIANTISTAASIGNSAACDTITVGTNTDADAITIGDTTDSTALVSNLWAIPTSGVATFPSVDTLSAGALLLGPTTATSVTIGRAAATAITLTTDGSGTGEVVLPTDAISSGEITNITRSVVLGYGVPCAGTVPGVWDAAGADTEADLVAVSNVIAVVYDPTGGEIDVDETCLSFVVPADYISGGTFVFRVTQGAATVTNIESIEARISVDGAAIGAADEDNLANQTAVQSITSAPTGTWAAGASIGLAYKQGNAAPDDTVNVLAVEAQYTASQ